MEVNYDALTGAASSLSAAASRVASESSVSSELGSGAGGPDDAHSGAAGDRKRTLQRLSELVRAQSQSCKEMVTLFQLLDAQIASQVTQR